LKQKMSFREIRYNEKREKILKNAAKIFAKKGYERASLEEIANQLKLTKASLYHYIKSKEEMLFLIQLQAIQQLRKGLEKVLQSDMDPVEKLTVAIQNHVKTVTQKHVIGALRQQELILPRKWRNEIISERDNYEEMIQKIIQEGIQKGIFNSLQWKISKMAALGALNWIVRWYSPRGALSDDEIADAMVDFILKGFLKNRESI